MKTAIYFMVTVMVLACNSHSLRAQDSGSVPQSQSNSANLSSARRQPSSFWNRASSLAWIGLNTAQTRCTREPF